MEFLRRTWGRRIADHRRAAGLTQFRLAILLDVTPQAVYLWERGVNSPKDEIKPRIAEALGVPVGELFAFPEPEEALA